MPPESKPTTPPDTTELKSVKDSGASKRSSNWRRITTRSRNYGRVAALLGAILVVGAVGGYFLSVGLNPPSNSKTAAPKVETLSPSEINKLSQVGTQLGNSNQTLTIGANSVFQGKVNVGSNLSVGGTLSANGPVSLSSLAISGNTNLSNLSVAQALQVSGLTNAKNGLTVQGLTAVNGNLSVSGAAAVGSLTTNIISTKTLEISGPLTISHLVSSGPPVSASNGSSLGSGGTVSVSGNDTTGTVNANVGSGAGAGPLVNVTFRSSYGGGVRVMLTPASAGAADNNVYVTTSPNGFTVNSAGSPSGSMSFDYFVLQ